MAAYQKVYYDHFRNSTYESNNPFHYNLDWMGKQGMILDLTSGNTSYQKHRQVWSAMSSMRFVNYRNDYFKNIYPSLIYSSSSPTGSSWLIPDNVAGAPNSVNSTQWYVSKNNNIQSASLNQSSSNLSSSDQQFSVQSIRAAFALDKLLRSSAYAPKHVKDQFEARFGVKVSSKVSYESEFLGSFMNDIVIGEVTSTANTNTGSVGDNLGAIGGKGIGSSRFGNDIDFYCDEDCFIIGVSYVIPRTSYDLDGIDGYNFKLVPSDFFQPEFQDLGLEPLELKELFYDASNSAANNSQLIGFRPRNMVYKSSYDRNLGPFKSAHIDALSVNSGYPVPIMNNGWLSPFVVHSGRNGITVGTAGVNAYYFKCFPVDVDEIFVQRYDGRLEAVQFFSNLVIKFVTNQDMSVHGQPRL